MTIIPQEDLVSKHKHALKPG